MYYGQSESGERLFVRVSHSVQREKNTLVLRRENLP